MIEIILIAISIQLAIITISLDRILSKLDGLALIPTVAKPHNKPSGGTSAPANGSGGAA